MAEQLQRRLFLKGCVAFLSLSACTSSDNLEFRLDTEPIQDIDEEIDKLASQEFLDQASKLSSLLGLSHNDLSIQTSRSGEIEQTAAHLHLSSHTKVQKAYLLSIAYNIRIQRNSIALYNTKSDQVKRDTIRANMRLKNEMNRIQNYTDNILYKK